LLLAADKVAEEIGQALDAASTRRREGWPVRASGKGERYVEAA
jgi:hypothetical protein